MTFTLYSRPEPVKAYKEVPECYIFTLDAVKSIAVSITAVDTFTKTVDVTGLTSVSIDVSHYLQDFTFDAFDTFKQESASQQISYSVTFTATYTNDTTKTLSYTGYSIPSC